MPINQGQFLGSNAKICVTYPINANIAIIISDFQQKYVVVKAMRRSGVISKNLLMKKLKSKVYVSFRISLYATHSLYISQSKLPISSFSVNNITEKSRPSNGSKIGSIPSINTYSLSKLAYYADL